MTLRIELSGRRGGSVLIDEQDQAFVQARRWYLAPTGYAMDSRGRLLHRELLGLQREVAEALRWCGICFLVGLTIATIFLASAIVDA